MKSFTPDGLPLLIGSLPMDDHEAALDLVLRHTPEIPLWVQLPGRPEEGMVAQFLPGFPGLEQKDGRTFVNLAGEEFDAALIRFYEQYMSVTDDGQDPSATDLAMTGATAPGFFTLVNRLESGRVSPAAVKGQITGPFTFATGLADQERRAVFYDDRTRDAAVKLLAVKARIQVRALSAAGVPVLLFLDEPALTGFGSSAFMSVTETDVTACFEEIFREVHESGGLAGVHVCGNTQWSLILNSGADVVSFDAFSYFDRFLLYADAIRAFIDRGGILALGIVPTLNPDDVKRVDADMLTDMLIRHVEALCGIGLDREVVIRRSLVTPACGAGSLPLDLAEKTLVLTAEVSRRFRKHFGLA